MKHKTSRSFLVSLLAIAFALVAPFSVHAETPVIPPASAPADPAAPIAAVVPSVIAGKKEGEEENPVIPALPAPASLTARVQAALAGLGGGNGAAQITALNTKITDLTGQLSERDKTIQGLQTRIAGLEKESADISALLTTAQTTAATVEATVASLGFDIAKLPGASALENTHENTIAGLHAKFTAETDPLARAGISAQIIALRDKKKA